MPRLRDRLFGDDDDDELETCEIVGAQPTSDEDIDGIVLFAGVAGGGVADIAKRKEEWEELFDAS